ncbi:hypothetical protein HAX54_009653 [Datura stramonium]|uniref:Uncharacterized protein n=1 Tax=Datura stramonium TaxID=4076 RepID=A0ABS8THP7_DATST|nr:hypothetical protein [Datura stramonium]
MLCLRASCSLFRPLDKIVWAKGVITLDTKTDKDDPALKQSKAAITASAPIDFFKIAQMSQAHESQIVKLAKAIPSMIQQAIKKITQPARDKLRGLCAIVEVLESDVISLRKDVDTLTGPPPASNTKPIEPAAVTSQPKAPKIPLVIGGWGMIVRQK